MLTLDNIYVGEIIQYRDEKVKEILDKNNIYTVKELVDFVKEHPECEFINYDHNLKLVKKAMQVANDLEIEPETYNVEEYQDKTLNDMDKLNNGEILLLSSPTLYSRAKYVHLNKYSILEIKKMLNLTDRRGKNIIKTNIRNIGDKSIDNIMFAIKMYNEQILRQAKLTPDRNINLFLKDKIEKQKIVIENYEDIIMYLVSKERTIWGELTEAQKKLYISSIINDNTLDIKIRKRMIDNISNYSTIEEIEEIKTEKEKILNRFIIK